jgi:galactokinase/mevalonate kinase-like predicted kinase
MYQQAQSQGAYGGQRPGAGAQPGFEGRAEETGKKRKDEGAVDAEYEVVDDK